MSQPAKEYRIEGREPKAVPYLLTPEKIVSASRSIIKLQGVYFLISNGQVVYVGATTNYYERIGRHFAKRKITFDSITFLPVDDEQEMWNLETHYIDQFKCKDNKVKNA